MTQTSRWLDKAIVLLENEGLKKAQRALNRGPLAERELCGPTWLSPTQSGPTIWTMLRQLISPLGRHERIPTSTLTNCCFKSNHCSFSLKIIYVARRLVWAVGGALRDKLPSPLLNCSLWRWTDLAMTSNTSPWRGNSSVSWRSSRIDESVTEPEGDSRSHALAYLLS